MKDIRICFVSPNAYGVLSDDRSVGVVGGAELQQVTIARQLARKGFDVTFVCSDYGQPPFQMIGSIKVYRTYNEGAGLPILRFFHPRLTATWAALKKADADIYFTRTASMYAGVVTKFCQLNSRKSVYSAADNTDFSGADSKIKFRRDLLIYEYGLRNCDKIIVQNKAQKELCWQNYGREATIISNCVPEQVSVPTRVGLKILWVSTIRELKRPQLLLDLARRLPHRQFVMVGGRARLQSSLYDSICSQAKELENVEFAGFVPFSEVGSYFNDSYVLVNTSATEGFPNSFLQAWSRAVPTVSFFDCEGQFQGRDVGYCVDTIEEMASTIERLFAAPEEREEAGMLCAAYCGKHHSLDGITTRYEETFLEMSQP